MIGLIRQSFSSSSKVAGIVMFLGLFLQVAFFFCFLHVIYTTMKRFSVQINVCYLKDK